jgi:N-acetyl-gamma-glutamylphosphate reductase
MNVTIVGASGYSGRQLVSILAGHPKVNLVGVTSRTYAGNPVESSIPHLRGKVEGLTFTNPSIKELGENTDCELFFLALPHGTAANYAIPLLNAGKKKSLIFQRIFDSKQTNVIRNFTVRPTPNRNGLDGLPTAYLKSMIFPGMIHA